MEERQREEIILIGKFQSIVAIGKYSTLYIFRDNKIGAMAIGVDKLLNTDNLLTGDGYLIKAHVYSKSRVAKDGNVFYEVRLSADEIIQLEAA